MGAFIPLFATSVIMDKYYSFKERIITFIFCFIIIAFAAFLILNYGMADRLLGGELMDGSANTRIEIWNIFKKADIEQFMRGFSESELKFMMKDFDFTAVENSFSYDYLI